MTTPDLQALIELSAKATAGEFRVEYETNLFAGDDRNATSLCSNMIDAHARNKANAEFLVAAANWFRHTAPTLPGAGGGDEPKWSEDIGCVIHELRAGRPELALKRALHLQSLQDDYADVCKYVGPLLDAWEIQTDGELQWEIRQTQLGEKLDALRDYMEDPEQRGNPASKDDLPPLVYSDMGG